MPLQTACPSCGSQFVVGEAQLGKKVRCKHCQNPFTVAAGAGEPPAAPPRPRARKKRRAWVAWLWILLGLLLAGGVVTAVILMTRPAVGPGGFPTGQGNAVARRLDTPYLLRDVRAVVVPRGDPEFVVVEVFRRPPDPAFRLERWSLKTGQKVNEFDVAAIAGHASLLDASPDASLVLTNKGADDKAVSLWSIPEKKAVLRDWAPSTLGGRPTGGWFLDSNRLLISRADGSAEVWTVPQMQSGRLAPPSQGRADAPGKFFHPAHYCALSADRKLFACWNGDGYDLFDTHTGQQRGRTDPTGLTAAPGERLERPFGTALSPDGKQLVALPRLDRGFGDAYDVLVHWDLDSGKVLGRCAFFSEEKKAEGKKKRTVGGFGLTFCGPKHVALLHSHQRCEIVSLEPLRLAGHAATSSVAGDGRVLPGTGRLWYLLGNEAQHNAQVFAVDLTDEAIQRLAASDMSRPLTGELSLRSTGLFVPQTKQ
jgi:predicted Zn finger-like uncharacterized protein